MPGSISPNFLARGLGCFGVGWPLEFEKLPGDEGTCRSGARPLVRMGSHHEWVAPVLATGVVPGSRVTFP